MKRASIIVLFITLIAIPGLAAEFTTNPNATPWRVDFPEVERALTTITHSATQSIVSGNSVSCNASGLHADNSYLRRFDLLAFGITGSIVDPAVDHLVVEVFTPDGQATGESFYIGSNADGQTGPSYIAAASCGITEPTDTAAIGFPDMHIVMNVTGDVLPVELMAFTIE
ncbi:MAG: hypothetical protein DRJ61_17770 [Acidobacteria bacterium]|nr:MAG: hypothetical protein DRJ61_17770 [Acidobacteriota bacterium]